MENKFIDIIQEPTYWVEEINNLMYDAMVKYMEDHNLNKTEFATHLGISKGRISQILNSGEINFSIEKLFYIALKIDKFPHIKLEDKQEYINTLQNNYKTKQLAYYSQKVENNMVYKMPRETKIIQFPIASNRQIPIAY